MSKKQNKYEFYDTMFSSGRSDESVAELRSVLRNTYINRFYNLFINKFSWNGLDEDVKEQEENYIMRKFWSEGTVAATKKDKIDLLVFSTYTAQTYNLYDFPETINYTNSRAIAANILPAGSQVVNKDAVIGWCQPNHKPVVAIVDSYITRIVEVDMVINTNLNLHKMPFMIGVSDADKLRMKDIVHRILNDETVIYADLKDLQKIQSIATNTPYIIDRLEIYRNNLENELLSYLGIDNTGKVEKKERLLTDEVNANNEEINNNADVMKDEIEKWLAQINRVFGRNITIEEKSAPAAALVEETHGIEPKQEVEKDVE